MDSTESCIELYLPYAKNLDVIFDFYSGTVDFIYTETYHFYNVFGMTRSLTGD